jgi:hypothetical protein
MLGPTATCPPHFELDNTCKPICGACFALTVGVTPPIHSYHEFSSSDKNLEVATQATAVLASPAMPKVLRLLLMLGYWIIWMNSGDYPTDR